MQAENSKCAPSPFAGFVALCCAIYFTSYLTRKCFEASMLAICDATGLARSAAGLAGTAAVVLYGSGQFVTGWLADRLDPRWIILAALLLTAACNAVMPVAAGSVVALVALNAVNGFAQAMFWPPLVKIAASSLTPERYKGAIFWINVAANAAIVATFALVAGCVRFAGWRLSFAIAAGAALAMAAVWASSIRRLAQSPVTRPAPKRRTEPRRNPLLRLLAAVGLIPITGAIICMGVMRDGIEAWAPGIVKDVYGVSTSGSTLSVVILPFFAVASLAAARALRLRLGDERKAALALFAAGFACAVALFASGGGGKVAVGLPLLAILSASMHGANLMLVCELPGRFAREGCVGTVSGILNAGVYVGAAFSVFGFPVLRELHSGWGIVFGLWVAVLGLGMVLLFLTLPRRRGNNK